MIQDDQTATRLQELRHNLDLDPAAGPRAGCNATAIARRSIACGYRAEIQRVSRSSPSTRTPSRLSCGSGGGAGGQDGDSGAGGSTGPLPVTGLPAVLLVAGGLALVAGGAVLVASGRRRRIRFSAGR